MKLVVMAGANRGTEIPLKKERFVIGRSSECTLRVGSESISRRHCALIRSSEGILVRDLGSRNGTFVNGKQIAADTILCDGDAISVGALELRFELSHDIDRSKKPKVQNVAEAVSRSADAPDDSSVIEEDISRWLVGPEPGASDAMRETRSFRIDETRAMPQPEVNPVADKRDTETSEPEVMETVVADADSIEAVAKGTKRGKKQVGKLPPLPPKQTAKDSRDAAADILREMTRRR
ncbi:MAG: FHA domain-containing protein [Aeoliella sp.]